MVKNTKTIGGYIAISELEKNRSIKEAFQGQTSDEEVMFPKGLGAKHPFEFEDVEKLYKKYGLVSETISKHVNAIITNFEIKLKNSNAHALIDDFVHTTNFHTVIRAWVAEALLKGNGYIELDLDNNKIRVLNANNIYVRRRKDGSIIEYVQWSQSFKNFNKESTDLIRFKPNKIAHLIINKIPGDPYGIGIIWPNERVIENLVKNEQDLQLIISRKAGSPYHIKVGQPGTNIPPGIVDAIKNKLQYLRNTVEWVTDADVEIKAIEFNVGDKLLNTQDYFFRQYCAGTGTPEVLFGSGQLNEGIANNQTADWKRRIESRQVEIGNVIEEKIIRPILKANNLDEQPDFVWDLPTEEDIDKRLGKIKDLLGTGILDPEMKAGLQIEAAKLMGLEELVDKLPTPEEAKAEDERKRQESFGVKTEAPTPQSKERRKEENIPQPEVPGVKDIKLIQKVNITENQDMTVKEWVNIKELAGFNYTDYLIQILNVLKDDQFSDLKGITEQDFVNGLLTQTQVDKLRLIMKKGFKENMTVREIEKELKSLDLKDRITETGIIAAENRPNIIARTETVRLANEGLVNLYRTNKIEKVRWLSAISDRTCEECAALNGQVFNINEMQVGVSQPPLHVNCRCSLISVIE